MGLPVLVSDVHCLGSESNIHECNYLTGDLDASCLHSRDAGMECVEGELELRALNVGQGSLC